MLILVEATGYKIAVDNVHFCEFRHRLPFELACLLNISGDVSIERITYHGTAHSHTFPMASAVTAGFTHYSNPAAPVPPSPTVVFSQSAGVPLQSGPILPPGPVFGNPAAAVIINNPVLPLQHHIPGGLRPGLKVTMIGKPAIGFDSFAIEFVKSATNEVAMQVNPRNRERAVVRNARLLNGWGHEERTSPAFPFVFGTSFVLTIRVEHNRFVIILNESFFADFHHRTAPLNMVDMVKVWGNVNVSSVNLSHEY